MRSDSISLCGADEGGWGDLGSGLGSEVGAHSCAMRMNGAAEKVLRRPARRKVAREGKMQSVQLQKWSGEGATRKFDWETVSIGEAMRQTGPYRCPECYKPVRIHKASADGSNPAHAEHRVGSKTCSLSCYFT
jgi:hypothetical protein